MESCIKYIIGLTGLMCAFTVCRDKSNPLLVMNHNTLANSLKKWQTLTFQKKNIMLDSDIFNFSLRSQVLVIQCYLLSRVSLRPVCVPYVQRVWKFVGNKGNGQSKDSYIFDKSWWKQKWSLTKFRIAVPYVTPIWHSFRK